VIQYESPSIERLYGFEQAELVGEQVAEYVHPEDVERVVGAYRTVVSSERGVEAVEYRHEVADGSYLWVESVASSNPTPSGCYVVNSRDVSERIERERALEARNERLDEFAQVLSHDLRNPLQVARGNLGLAMAESDSEHLREVELAHERMQALVDDLLALARDGATVRDPEPADLATVAADCWAVVETDDGTLDVCVERSIRADRSRLRQLFENLLRNSVEASDGGVAVEVGALPGGFYVADDGPGIDERDRERVFDAGYSDDVDGTGIGLRIVEQVAREHGWTVSATESSDGGARFEVTNVAFADDSAG
jgi:PAS domain S-box-containing protein